MKKSVGITMLWLFCASVLFFALQQPVHAKKKKKVIDSFYRVTRFIMTKEEIDIYKHLEGQGDKQQFIAEFWKKRDPDPSTDDNASREEYNKRIAFANKWFRETPKGAGWDTERGRILLQLGFPDQRTFGQAPVTSQGRLLTSKRVPMERWMYRRYQLQLVFTDTRDSGRLTMSKIPGNLLTTMDLNRFALDLRESYNVTKRSFKFDVKYNSGNLNVKIPVKKLSFEEKGDQMNVNFKAKVYVYHNNKKVEEVDVAKNFSWGKADLLKLKNVKFDIPYALKDKGKYYFDVVIEEMGSSSKFRDFAKAKI